MIDLNAIKARLAAATLGPWRKQLCACGLGCEDSASVKAGGALVVLCAPDADADLVANAPTDIAALIAEIERLRAVLDGPPICVCGSDFDELHADADCFSPACYVYTCQNPDCGQEIGNNGEIAERLTLRTNPQTERLVARIFGR